MDSFLYQAAIRGFNFDLEEKGVSIEFGKTDDPDVNAYCALNSSTIVLDSLAWKSLSQPGKEFVVSHELGHCLLHRLHRNEKSDRQECISLLRGNEGGFTCWCNFSTYYWKKYYYDELFAATPVSLNDVFYKPLSTFDMANAQLVYSLTDSTLSHSRFTLPWQIQTDSSYRIALQLEPWDQPGINILNIRLNDFALRIRKQPPNLTIDNALTFEDYYYTNQLWFDLNLPEIRVEFIRIRQYLYLKINGHLVHGFDASGLSTVSKFQTNTLEGDFTVQAEIQYFE